MTVNLMRLLALLMLAACLPAHADQSSRATNTVWTRGTMYGPQGYLEYLPPSYDEREKSPLIIFLSGRGQAGPGTLDSLDNLGNIGLAEEIKRGRWPRERPFIVLSPQHLTGANCPAADEIDAFIQFAKATYKVDQERIYITGMSCGARGVADYLAKYGGKDVAAAVPMSGDLTPAFEAQRCALVRDVALFGVHGGLDRVIPAEPDRTAFANFAACPQRRDVEYVEYPDAGHAEPFIWMYSRAADYDVFAWMLHFTKSHRVYVQRNVQLINDAR